MRMRYRLALLVAICILVIETHSSASHAQTNPPNVRSETTVVLVPTLVRTKSGDVVHGLTAGDFVIKDNGIEQTVHLDDSPDAEPLSIVVAVETGGAAALLFPKPEAAKDGSAGPPLTDLGTMMQAFVGQDKADVAVIAFDSQVRLVQDFSDDIAGVSNRLDKLSPGDDGAAILDAVSYSAGLLNRRPANGRHILILISEMRDQGSHVARIANIVQEIGLSNTLVYSLAFSAARAQFMHDLHQQPARGTYPNLLAPLMIGANAVRKNTARNIARLAGGEYATFTNARNFDEQMETFAGDDRDRYMLTFQPMNSKPGPHNISVRLRNPRTGYVVTARSMYWSVAKARQH